MDPNRFTYGVEEEYQLVDPGSGALRSRAEEVLATDWSGEIEGEVQQTQLEVATPVCASAAEVRAELQRLRFQTGTVAAAHGLEIVAAGLHPFSGWKEHRPSGSERTRMLMARYGRLIRDEHIFGMHVHVAVPPPHHRVELLDRVAGYTPHLLALSASSPRFEGEDTGYASYRAVLNQRLPFSGAPPRFRSVEEYQAFVELLVRTDAIPDRGSLYWTVRLSVEYPTLEFRVCDVCPRLEDAAAIAALTRALVVLAAEGELPAFPRAPEMDPCLTAPLRLHNEWRAARGGLDAHLLDPAAPSGRRPLREALPELIERAVPVVRALGDADALEPLREILRGGNGAERIRARFGPERPGREIVAWLIEETRLGTGLDRRTSQRERENACDR